MKLFAALAAFSFLTPATSLRFGSHLGRVDASDEAAAEDDSRFLESTWRALTSELQEVQDIISPEQRAIGAAKLAKLKAVMAEGKASNAKAGLVPELAMLNGLYQNQKDRIKSVNDHEHKSKERFASHQKDYDGKMAVLKHKLDSHLLDQESYLNGTKEAARLFAHWQWLRTHDHKGFHNSLELTHGLMKKEKSMMNAYESTINGKAPSADGARELAKVKRPSPVTVALLQRNELAHYCRTALVTARAELASLAAGHVPNEG